MKASGKNVRKVQIINDRGIHICKSMIAWKEFGNGETPENSGVKGDHLVGKYYIEFDKQYKRQVSELISLGMDKNQAGERDLQFLYIFIKMLRMWESRDKETISLWKKMNQWVFMMDLK